MATISTPNGMQSGTDATELTFYQGWWKVWEQGGTSTTAGFVNESLNPDSFFTWKKTRSDDNKNNHGYGP